MFWQPNDTPLTMQIRLLISAILVSVWNIGTADLYTQISAHSGIIHKKVVMYQMKRCQSQHKHMYITNNIINLLLILTHNSKQQQASLWRTIFFFSYSFFDVLQLLQTVHQSYAVTTLLCINNFGWYAQQIETTTVYMYTQYSQSNQC